MNNSKSLAGIIGPVLVAFALTENPWVNPHLYDNQIAPVVYLSGTLLFIAGLSIIRAHNLWCRSWPVLITSVGWLALALGLVRMMWPHAYLETAPADSGGMIVTLLVILVLGLFLTFKGYFTTPMGD